MATDHGGLSTAVQYIIEVEDENDNSPTFQGSSNHIQFVEEDYEVGQSYSRILQS